MFTLARLDPFADWYASLRDRRTQSRVTQRLLRAQFGHLGDVKQVADKVFEMRLDFGPGYRIYYCRRDDVILLLLCAGDKSSQRRDISRAIALAAEWEQRTWPITTPCE